MRLRHQLVLVAVFLCSIFPFGLAEKVNDIQPTGYVIDLANVMTPEAKAKISAMATELQQKTGAQIAVVTVNSLEGEDREQYAADLYKHLGVGPKKNDEGVLLLVAPKERQYKIEVGYGLEPVINDARAGDIGRSMVPSLRANDYSAAILSAMTQIAELVAADKGVTLTGVPNRARAPTRGTNNIPWWLIFIGIFIVFQIIRALIRRGGGGGPGSGLRSRGSWVPPVIFMPAHGRRLGTWGWLWRQLRWLRWLWRRRRVWRLRRRPEWWRRGRGKLVSQLSIVSGQLSERISGVRCQISGFRRAHAVLL